MIYSTYWLSSSRNGSEVSSRTPSYQGLKLLTLSDIYTLRETAILSDSDPEDTYSMHSFPDRETGKNLCLSSQTGIDRIE